MIRFLELRRSAPPHRLRHARGQLQRAPARDPVHERRRKGPYRADEIGDLAAQRFVTLDWQRSTLNRRARAVAAHEPPSLDLLRGVIDRDVGIGLKEADLAHTLLA